MSARDDYPSLAALDAAPDPGWEDSMSAPLDVEAIWSPKWDKLETEIRDHPCACCGQRGHYQQHLEALIAEHGFRGGVALDPDGSVGDGHHRVVAAHTLGIRHVPIEPSEARHERWKVDQAALCALVPPAPVPCEVWRWSQAVQEAGYRCEPSDVDVPPNRPEGTQRANLRAPRPGEIPYKTYWGNPLPDPILEALLDEEERIARQPRRGPSESTNTAKEPK
jgi:hypothetical protein